MPLAPELHTSITVGHRRARLTCWALGLVGAISAASLMLCLWGLWIVGELARGVAPLNGPGLEHLAGILRALQSVAWPMSFVLLLRWLHRALLNAALLNPKAVVPQPARGVVDFFIPIANLVAPVENLSALHRAVNPADYPLPVTVVDDQSAGYRDPARLEVVKPWRRVEAPIALWWACWLATLVVPLAARLWLSPEVSGLENARLGVIASILLEALRLAQAALGVLVVGAIDRRTAELARRRDALPA